MVGTGYLGLGGEHQGLSEVGVRLGMRASVAWSQGGGRRRVFGGWAWAISFSPGLS
jgi:hypothetical protein